MSRYRESNLCLDWPARAACSAWLVVLDIHTNTFHKRHALTEDKLDDIGA